MRQISLNQNKVVYLDDDDFDRLSHFHWIYRGERDGETGYAIRHAKDGKKTKTVYLHREIMNPPTDREVIFKNHDRLDCRRENLAIVTKAEARRSHRVRRDSKTGIKGVHFNPAGKTWSAFTYRDGHYHSLGAFYSKAEAIQEYKNALMREIPELANAPAVIERAAERPKADVDQTPMPV